MASQKQSDDQNPLNKVLGVYSNAFGECFNNLVNNYGLARHEALTLLLGFMEIYNQVGKGDKK